jgi:predicted transcriptional regulator
LLAACRDEPRSRREIEAVTDKSRATVYRATTELEADDLMEKDSDGYRTTPKGTALSHAVERFDDGVETVDRLEPLFDVVSHPELLANADLFADADVVVATDADRYRAADRGLELWKASETARSVRTGLGSRHCLEESTRNALATGMDVEMVLHPDAMPSSEALERWEFDVSEMLGAFETSVSERPPFSFSLFDETVFLIGYGEVQVPVVGVETDDPLAYRWAEELYRECKASARPLGAVPA